MRPRALRRRRCHPARCTARIGIATTDPALASRSGIEVARYPSGSHLRLRADDVALAADPRPVRRRRRRAPRCRPRRSRPDRPIPCTPISLKLPSISSDRQIERVDVVDVAVDLSAIRRRPALDVVRVARDDQRADARPHAPGCRGPRSSPARSRRTWYSPGSVKHRVVAVGARRLGGRASPTGSGSRGCGGARAPPARPARRTARSGVQAPSRAPARGLRSAGSDRVLTSVMRRAYVPPRVARVTRYVGPAAACARRRTSVSACPPAPHPSCPAPSCRPSGSPITSAPTGLVVLDASVVGYTQPNGRHGYLSGHEQYLLEGHIPGAVFADVIDELSDPDGPVPVHASRAPSAFAAAAGALGIGERHHRRRLRLRGRAVGGAGLVAVPGVRIRQRRGARRRAHPVARRGPRTRTRARRARFPRSSRRSSDPSSGSTRRSSRACCAASTTPRWSAPLLRRSSPARSSPAPAEGTSPAAARLRRRDSSTATAAPTSTATKLARHPGARPRRTAHRHLLRRRHRGGVGRARAHAAGRAARSPSTTGRSTSGRPTRRPTLVTIAG